MRKPSIRLAHALVLAMLLGAAGWILTDGALAQGFGGQRLKSDYSICNGEALRRNRIHSVFMVDIGACESDDVEEQVAQPHLRWRNQSRRQ